MKNNKENGNGYIGVLFGEQLKDKYPPECQKRAGNYISRVEKLISKYKQGKNSIKIETSEEKLSFVIDIQSLADRFLTDLEQFDEKTQSIITHQDDLPENLKLKSLQAKKDRIYGVALNLAREKDKENKEEDWRRENFFSLLETSINKKSFLFEAFGVPCREDAQKLLQFEALNDSPFFEQNPLENLFKLYEMGANSVRFESISFRGKKIEALAIELPFKLNNEVKIEKLWVSPEVNETLSTVFNFFSC